jgi:hypothetical protein
VVVVYLDLLVLPEAVVVDHGQAAATDLWITAVPAVVVVLLAVADLTQIPVAVDSVHMVDTELWVLVIQAGRVYVTMLTLKTHIKAAAEVEQVALVQVLQTVVKIIAVASVAI